MLKINCLLVFIASLFLLTQGCKGTFNALGDELGDGIRTHSDTIGQELIKGLSSGLDDSLNQQKLRRLINLLVKDAALTLDSSLQNLPIDSLSNKLIASLQHNLSDPGFRDSLSNLINFLVKGVGTTVRSEFGMVMDSLLLQLTEEETRLKIEIFREELLGAKTTAAIRALLQESLADLLPDSAIAHLRYELLGPQTNESIRAIVDSAMTTVISRVNKDLNPALQKNVSFIQKHALNIIIVLALLAMGIIAFIWYTRRKYLKLTSLLASQIFEMTDQSAYDDLTARIKKSAIASSLEPTLREVLSENGILGKDAWESHKGKTKEI
ncbi:MAG: hypothetical protein DHS20C18_11630 [Saprospiraceae bacterium]|nr:MAG: hypothetical protein DHS20C18_11630 [Saprospiraceae bacterium]